MRITQIHFIAACVTISMSYSGCASIQGGSAVENYRELKDVSYESTAQVHEDESDFELTPGSSVSDYRAYAALHNPGLRAAFNKWKAALEKIPQVRSLPDPRFTYAYFIESVETRVGPQRHRLDLSQTFPWFGELDLMGDVALEEANIQRQAYEMQKLELFYAVEAAYNEYYFLARSIAVAEENLKLLSYFERVARSEYESGNAAYADVMKAQVELGRLEERLLSLRGMQMPLAGKINAVLNRAQDAPVPQPMSIQERNVELSDDELIRQVTEYNPDLKALEMRINKESKAKELARKQFYPNVMIGLSYVETGPSPMAGTKDSGKDPVMTMFSVNLPIWRDKYKAAVREADIRRKSAERTLANRENGLVSELKTALYNYHDAGRKKELYRDNLIPKAKQALNVTQSAFESGKKDFMSLIDTQRTLLEFELSYERARADRETNRARIEMLMGKEL